MNRVQKLCADAMRGALAGAAGTAMLDATTYADIAIRGRPPSELPDKMVRALAKNLGLAGLAASDSKLSTELKNRRAGLGALLGYADGFGSGLVFGVVRPYVRGMPWFVSGIALAVATGLASEGTATLLKQTNPKKWGAAGWLADLIPRCIYGWTTCIAFDLMADA